MRTQLKIGGGQVTADEADAKEIRKYLRRNPPSLSTGEELDTVSGVSTNACIISMFLSRDCLKPVVSTIEID